MSQRRPKLLIVRDHGDAHNALIYWKSEAQRLKKRLRDLEAQNARLHTFARPLLMAHLKLRAETRHQLDRLGMSDVDVILQLAASKSDEEFGPWFAELVNVFDQRR
jgi:hypothetical protein